MRQLLEDRARNNCFPDPNTRKILPPRVNNIEKTDQPKNWNEIIEQERAEYELTTLPENCNTFDANSQEFYKARKTTTEHRSRSQFTKTQLLQNSNEIKGTA